MRSSNKKSFPAYRKLRNKLCFCLSAVPLLLGNLFADELENALLPIAQAENAQPLTIDLKEPIYRDGILSTDKGGVISGPNFRLQALHIEYSRQGIKGISASTVKAEGQVIVEFGEYLFIADKIIYDFEKREGTLYHAKSASEPWYFGGKEIELRPDGSYLIFDGFVTTSESEQPDWALHAKQLEIDSQKSYLKAENLELQVYEYPILWIPSFKASLDTIFDNPFRYRLRWGGKQGPRIGLTYELFSWAGWRTNLRFDYRLTRGPGGGIETFYLSEDHKTEFESINYVANDSALSNLGEKVRYRFEGKFKKSMLNDKLNILFSYDKLSDIDLPSEFHDNDFDLETSNRTQLLIRHQEENWIAKFYSRVRVNYFQTVKQELPTFSTNWRPLALGSTGIIAENKAQVSYIDFQYASNMIDVHNYASTRLEYRPNFYRPFHFGHLTLTPEIGAVGIFYGNSPKQDEQCLCSAHTGFELNTHLFRFYGPVKHVIEPYSRYSYYTAPTSSPNQHFIFDINDGWARLNELTFGFRNSLFGKKADGCISRLFFADIYLRAFINTPTIDKPIPKIYGRFAFNTHPSVEYLISSAWSFDHNELDYINARVGWTLDANFAVAAEYRHRGPYDWRKADTDNFFLDSFRSESSLRHSQLSDRRDTFLFHAFYRFHPKWSGEVISRHGWNRLTQPDYLEYEINLYTTSRTAWNWKLSYQHLEGDDRIAVYLNIGLKRPDCRALNQKPACYE